MYLPVGYLWLHHIRWFHVTSALNGTQISLRGRCHWRIEPVLYTCWQCKVYGSALRVAASRSAIGAMPNLSGLGGALSAELQGLYAELNMLLCCTVPGQQQSTTGPCC
jgi:hypothetical protein